MERGRIVIFIRKDFNMKKRDPNYKGMYLIGIALVTVGISLINLQPKPAGLVFIIVGGVFLITSLKNKSKWKDRD